MNLYQLDLSKAQLPEGWPVRIVSLPLIEGQYDKDWDIDEADIDRDTYQALIDYLIKKHPGSVSQDDARFCIRFGVSKKSLPIGAVVRAGAGLGCNQGLI